MWGPVRRLEMSSEFGEDRIKRTHKGLTDFLGTIGSGTKRTA